MIGAFIREIRSSRGMTQQELAEVSGIDQPNLSAYETGRRVPTADTLNRLVVSCGYRLAAVAGDARISCDLPRVGWFPDEDVPPRLPDDPPDEAPVVGPDTPLDERVRVLRAVLDP